MDELVNLFHKFDVVPQSDSENYQSKRIGREVAINTKTSSSGFIEDAASNPSKGILHNVAAQVKAKLNIDMELQYITRDIAVNPRDLPLKETSLFLSWPEPYKTYGQGRSKKTAEHDAADHALQYLKSLNVLTEDGRLSIVSGGGERRRNHGRKRGDCEDGRKRKEDRRRKWDKDQETGNWGCRTKEEPKDVHHGSRSERGKCIYKEVDWWNKDGVAMDEEVDGDCEGERAADEEVVEDWWDRAGEEATDGESKPGTKRLSLINSLGMEPSKRLCSRQDEEAAVGSRTARIGDMKKSQLYVCKSSKVPSSGGRQLSMEEGPPPHLRLRSSALGEEVDRLRKGLTLGPLDDSFDSADLEKIQRQFPSCKNTLHNAFAAVAQEFRDPTLQPKPVYRPVQNLWPSKSWRSSQKSNGFSGDGWECTYHLRWPEVRSFSGEARAKAAAATQAALKALLWLRQQGRVTKEGNVNFSSAVAATAAVAFRRGEPETRPGKRESASSNGVAAGATVAATLAPLDPSAMKEAEKLLERYHKEVEPLLVEKKGQCRGSDSLHIYRRYTTEEEDGTALSEDDGSSDVLGRGELSDPITGRHYRKPDKRKVARRSEEMRQRIIQQHEAESGLGDGRMAMELRHFRDIQESLPIAKFRQEIISLIEENRVVVVTGEAGCGKSTQVPQFILDDWAAQGLGGYCNIVVTQPRRISATSLAERVSHERLERVGDTVGYQVRLESRLPSSAISCGGGGGSILFCSVGILLRRLQTNPNLIGASHVILDEAHQRDVGTDVLATLLRRALAANPSLRLIVMSATLDAPLFAAFFGNAPTVRVPGFTYPVKEYFLEDLENEVLHMRYCNGLHLSACEEESGGAIDFEKLKLASERPNPVIDCEQVARVVRWVDSSRPPGGAVLVFLPGWAEIKAVASILEKSPVSSSKRSISSRLLILPVHSRLSYSEQRRIFDRAPAGTRKVIVATDVAETGITVDDVEYVVDTGAHREERFDAEKGVSCVDVHWASSASIRQRRGRAGRVRPGQAFHLYTRSRQEALLPYPLPEVHRVPLEKTVLDCKTYSRDMRAAEFLSEMPEPPPNDSVVQAVRELVALGALEEGPEERLTPLGRRIALFTTHPKLSKALVHAAIFRCVSPMVTIATVLSVEREPFQSALVDKAGVRGAKSHFCPTSDHLALSFIHEKWEETMNARNSSMSSENFCSSYGLSRDSMALIQSLRRIYAEHLYQSRLLPTTEDIGLEDDDDHDWRKRRGNTNGSSMTWSSWRRGRTNGITAEGLDSFADRSSRCNQLAVENELVLGVLLSGVGSILRRRQWDMRKGKVKKNAPTLVTDDGQRATLGSESVNNGRWGESRCPPFLTYFRQVRSQERKSILVREASLLSPILILLFANPQGQVYKVPRKVVDSPSQVSLVLQGKRELELHCDERQAQILVGLREAMWKVVDYFVQEEGRMSVRNVHYQTILSFHERLLLLLPELLRSDPTVPKNMSLKVMTESRDSKLSRNYPQPHYAEESREIQGLLDKKEVEEIRSLKCVREVKDSRDSRSSHEFWSGKSTRGARDLRERKALDGSKEMRDSGDGRGRDCCEMKDLRDWRTSRSEKNVLNWRDTKDWRDTRDCMDSNNSRDARCVRESSNNAFSEDCRSVRCLRGGDVRHSEQRDYGDFMEYKEERQSRNGRDERMSHKGRESYGFRDNRYASDAWDVKNSRNLRFVKVCKGSRIMRDSKDCRESVDLRDISNGRNSYDLEDCVHEREFADFRKEIWDGKDVCSQSDSCSNSLLLERSGSNSSKNRKITGSAKERGDLCNEWNGRRVVSDSNGLDHDCWRRHDSRDFVDIRGIQIERNVENCLKAEKNALKMQNPREQMNIKGQTNIKNGILGDLKPKDSYGEGRKSYEEMRDLRCSYRLKNGKDLSECDVSVSSHDLYSSYGEMDLQGEDAKLFKDLRNSKCVEKSSMVQMTWRGENEEEARHRVVGEQMEVGDRKTKREVSSKWSRKSSIGGH